MKRIRFLLFFGGAPFVIAQPDSLTLDESIRFAWANDPAVAALALTTELSASREVQAGIKPNPEINLDGSVPMDGASEWSLGVGVRRQLVPAERRELARALARVGGEKTAHQLREQRRHVAGLVRQLYYELALVEQSREFLAQSWKSSKSWFAVIERRFEAGEISEAEKEILRLDMVRTEQALALAAAESIVLQERLRIRLRWPSEEPVSFAADLVALIDLPLPDSLPAVDENSHPQLALAAIAVREANAAVALAQNQSRADWTLGAGLGFERRANDATGRLEDEPTVRMSASVPWMREVPNRGDVLERQARERIAEANLAGLRQELVMQLEADGAEVRQLQPVVRRYRRMIEEATQLFTQLQAAYRRGEVNAFELIRSRDERLDLQADYLAAAQRYLKALGAAQHRAGMMPTQL